MIRNNLSTLMGKNRVRIADVARETGLSACGLSSIYYGKTAGVRFDSLDKLCSFFSCEVGDILQYVPDERGDC